MVRLGFLYGGMGGVGTESHIPPKQVSADFSGTVTGLTTIVYTASLIALGFGIEGLGVEEHRLVGYGLRGFRPTHVHGPHGGGCSCQEHVYYATYVYLMLVGVCVYIQTHVHTQNIQ